MAHIYLKGFYIGNFNDFLKIMLQYQKQKYV